MFAVLFTRYANFHENKILVKRRNHSAFLIKVNHALVAKIKFSRNFPNLQYLKSSAIYPAALQTMKTCLFLNAYFIETMKAVEMCF